MSISIKMKKNIFTSIIFLCSFTALADSKSVFVEEKAIREQRAISNQAIVDRDIESFLATLMQDYHIVTSANMRLFGHEEQREMMRKLYTDYPDALYVRTPSTIKLSSDLNFAAETGSWTGSMTRNGRKVKMQGRYFARWVKFQERWLIQAEIFVPLKP